MMNKVPQKKINELELTVRTIQEMVPDLPTSQLQKWKGIFTTALAHVDQELRAVSLHTCVLCLLQEWGYRDDLPMSWFQKGDAEICFGHSYEEAEKELKAMKRDTDAFLPPDDAPITLGGLKVQMENLPEPPTNIEQTVDELMALL